MSDRLLLLHWNELSIPAEITAAELNADPRWAQFAQLSLSAFLEVLTVRPDCRLSFTKGTFHGQVADRPLQSWLEVWLGKERWRKLRSRAVQPSAQSLMPAHSLECELTCNGRHGEGITRAYIADSWTLSLGSEVNGFTDHQIRAVKTTIDSDGQVNVDVPNLADSKHVGQWSGDLAVWGQIVSTNHVVAKLDRYSIIMYPLDHGYPHVHVHVQDDPKLNAKYRVDFFEPLTSKRPVGLDAVMETWIEQRRDHLVRSWARCQAGGFPLKLPD